MTSQNVESTLTDKKGMGGITAQEGFDFQVWNGLIRTPGWLRNPAFEGLIFEGLEDFEARFFAPHAPHRHVLEQFQVKSGAPTRSVLVDVFRSFQAFGVAHPQIARVQTLVVPGLPSSLAWIARDPGRVRRARPFYQPFAEVWAASNKRLLEDLIAEFGPELGRFVADSVEIEVRSLPDRRTAEAVFASAISESFPHLDVGARRMAAAFAALSDVAAESRGAMITRERLLNVLGEAIGEHLSPERALHVHVRSDRNGASSDALEIDASVFSGTRGPYPTSDKWRSGLLDVLDVTACWARSRNYERVKLTGSFRISTAFTIGWVFRSANGFEIEVATRTGLWATDNRPMPDAAPLCWRIEEAKGPLVGGTLVVAIGVLRDPSRDAVESFGLPDDRSVLAAFLPQPLADSADTQAYVQEVKNVVSAPISQLGVQQIDLLVAGPAAFAVALGHRWNALPPTQLYEFLAQERRYVPTIRLG